jgi:hypothetical protein
MTECFRRGLPLVLAAGLAALAGPARAADGRLDTSPAASEARLKKDIFFLAGPECEGRGVDTEGINKAADHIAAEFKKAGLKPGGVNGTYFQPFPIKGSPRLGNANAVSFTGPDGKAVTLESGKQFQTQGFSANGKVTGPLVFAGFGITSEKPAYDDYAGLDVAGKVVIVLRKSPKLFTADEAEPYSSFVAKLDNAGKHKAAGVLFVNDSSMAKGGDDLPGFRNLLFATATAQLPAVFVSRDSVDHLLPDGQKLADQESLINSENKPHGLALAGWTAKVETEIERPTYTAKNIIGYLDGAGPLADQIVITGAHYDHLGKGGFGSMGGASAVGKVHYGADDNGSGSATVMELARRFGAQTDRQGRRLVFMTFSGEERGLLGSRFYCNEQPLFPLKDTAAMVNLDMVGRLRPDEKTHLGKLDVYGTGTGTGFEALADEMAKKHDLTIKKTPGASMGGGGDSDHSSFYRKNIPVFFFFSGYHPDYHRPTDTPDKINVAGMRQIADLTQDLVARLAMQKERPEYVKVAGRTPAVAVTTPGGERPIARLGLMPNYDSADGLLIEDISPGGAAEKGGLKKGDKIVEIAGRPVKDVTGYMAEMARQKAGQEIELTVVRDGKRMPIKVTPQ